MILEGKTIDLRPLEIRDAEALLSFCKEPGIARYNPFWAEGETKEDYAQLIESTRDAYAIVRKGEDTPIGVVGFEINVDLNETALYFFLSDACKGMGYTKEAVTLLSDWCLKETDNKYLILVVPASHASEGRMAEKCGFMLYEKRVTIGHTLAGLTEDTYYYYRKF